MLHAAAGHETRYNKEARPKAGLLYYVMEGGSLFTFSEGIAKRYFRHTVKGLYVAVAFVQRA